MQVSPPRLQSGHAGDARLQMITFRVKLLQPSRVAHDDRSAFKFSLALRQGLGYWRVDDHVIWPGEGVVLVKGACAEACRAQRMPVDGAQVLNIQVGDGPFLLPLPRSHTPQSQPLRERTLCVQCSLIRDQASSLFEGKSLQVGSRSC